MNRYASALHDRVIGRMRDKHDAIESGDILADCNVSVPPDISQ
jgi:hypothetical protein